MCCYRSRLVFSCCFSDTDILQGNVATHSRFGDIYSTVTNFPMILIVKIVWKLFNIWRCYKACKNVPNVLGHPVRIVDKYVYSFWVTAVTLTTFVSPVLSAVDKILKQWMWRYGYKTIESNAPYRTKNCREVAKPKSVNRENFLDHMLRDKDGGAWQWIDAKHMIWMK